MSTFILLFLILCASGETCTVEKIYDGDTFVCNGEVIRLIGIDCPETKENKRIGYQRKLGDTKTIIKLGKRATRFVEKLIPVGTKVRLEFDVQRYDKYGRTLAYVWLPDGRLLNEVILAEGYAMLLTIPPNVKYVERFQKAEQQANQHLDCGRLPSPVSTKKTEYLAISNF
ncbi:MAG: hypothetical protein CH6_2535 [Candidatus Kapaibacterium sp.]|nr:MAG: hypothetical protein CH6_2535 [Candidatus Kapabacteria bacterium]